MKKRLFESEEEFKERVRREEIEAKTGVKKRLFESDEHYKERANRVYRNKMAGIRRRLFESKEHFEQRQEAAITEKTTGIQKMRRESFEEYIARAEREALCRKHHIFQDKHGHHHGGISDEEHKRNQIHAMEDITGFYREFHEPEDHYIRRLALATLSILGHTTQKPYESRREFALRSRIEALKYDPELVERLGLIDWEEN